MEEENEEDKEEEENYNYHVIYCFLNIFFLLYLFFSWLEKKLFYLIKNLSL